MTQTKTVLVAVSDMHINSTVALCPPVVNLDDGGTYHANRTQRWLWQCWQDFWRYADETYPAAEFRRIAIVNGDLGELDTKRRSIQVITVNKATIQNICIDTLRPLTDWAQAVYIVRGTAAHTGKSAWLEEAIAGDLDNTVRETPDGAASWWHIRSVCEGVRLDIAHHASMGGLPWGKVNAASRLAAKIVWQYVIQHKQPAPHLVLRSHNHTAVNSEVEDTEVWFTPAWTTLTEHGYRSGFENDLAQIGGVFVECEGGRAKVYNRLYKPEKERKLWTFKM